GGEVGDTAAGDGEPLADRRGGVLAFRLEEHERVAPEVRLGIHDGPVEPAAHRRGAGDRGGPGGLSDVDLHVHDGLGAVASRRDARVLVAGLGGLGLWFARAHRLIGEDRAHFLPVLPCDPAPGPLRSWYTIRLIPARPIAQSCPVAPAGGPEQSL